ncbi:hypothetical protein IAT40_000656 [Kwoniella sp. CBS 6097]
MTEVNVMMSSAGTSAKNSGASVIHPTNLGSEPDDEFVQPQGANDPSFPQGTEGDRSLSAAKHALILASVRLVDAKGTLSQGNATDQGEFKGPGTVFTADRGDGATSKPEPAGGKPHNEGNGSFLSTAGSIIGSKASQVINGTCEGLMAVGEKTSSLCATHIPNTGQIALHGAALSAALAAGAGLASVVDQVDSSVAETILSAASQAALGVYEAWNVANAEEPNQALRPFF